jgi:macrolide transport system ATP-binding/permease protein
MALGARRSAVYTMVLGEAGRLSLAGIVCGALGSLGSATLISSFLFNTPPRDFATLVWVALTLGGASLVASFVPARRAASVDPATALRAE